MTTTIELPTERTKQEIDALARPMLVYGRKKSGKSTLAANLDPDHTLFLATEPGHAALEIMRQTIDNWEDFLKVLVLLREGRGKLPYKLIVVDTVDVLARHCADYVVDGMKGSRKGFVHPSDFDWGKGWDAIADEFRRRMGQLASLGYGVLFISHEKESTVKERNGAEVTKFSPDVGQKGMRNWLLGFVDVIAYAQIIQTKEGQQHILRLKPTEQIEAGGRIPESIVDQIPEAIPLRADQFRAVLEKVAAA